MGFFSWETSDTKESIPNVYQNNREVFEVYMIVPDGRKWKESKYEGYGIFGGKDYYELVAELNGKGRDRAKGIELAFNCKNVILPKFVRDSKISWNAVANSEACNYQGYFYEDEFFEDQEY